MQLREHLPARGAGLQAEGGRRVQEPDEDVRVQNPEPRRHARLQGQGAVSGDHGWVPGARLWLLSSAADNRRRRLQPGKCLIRGLLRDCENRWIVCSSTLHQPATDGAAASGPAVGGDGAFHGEVARPVAAEAHARLPAPSRASPARAKREMASAITKSATKLKL